MSLSPRSGQIMDSSFLLPQFILLLPSASLSLSATFNFTHFLSLALFSLLNFEVLDRQIDTLTGRGKHTLTIWGIYAAQNYVRVSKTVGFRGLRNGTFVSASVQYGFMYKCILFLTLMI